MAYNPRYKIITRQSWEEPLVIASIHHRSTKSCSKPCPLSHLILSTARLVVMGGEDYWFPKFTQLAKAKTRIQLVWLQTSHG